MEIVKKYVLITEYLGHRNINIFKSMETLEYFLSKLEYYEPCESVEIMVRIEVVQTYRLKR
jgi:hypothetical protein